MNFLHQIIFCVAVPGDHLVACIAHDYQKYQQGEKGAKNRSIVFRVAWHYQFERHSEAIKFQKVIQKFAACA